MKPTWRVVILAAAVLLSTAFSGVLCRAQEVSHARIVRLSFVEGSVALQRPGLEDWTLAPVNTPIQEGFRLATDQSGFAEVEFENSSTARLGQYSMLEFTQLALLPSGAKLNRLTLHQGYATFNVLPQGEDLYEVKAGASTLTPRKKSRFRIDLEEGVMQLKVFQGAVEFVSAEGNGTIGRNTVLRVEFGAGHPLQLTQGISKDAWDEWVEERESRLEAAQSSLGQARPSGVGDSFFGFNDLAFYGNWFSDVDYGYVWVPTVDAGWNPYAWGRWVWYPGFGYVWISDHPWGWVPYHYGSWFYRPAIGWLWIPGGFQAWSPAGVNWFRGPGWIGWHPRSPLPGGRQPNCPSGGCVVSVADQHFRNGNPVGPIRNIGGTGGVPIDRPGVEPGRFGRLPGVPLPTSGTHSAVPVGKPVTPPLAAGVVRAPNPPGGVTSGSRPSLPFQPRQNEPRGGPAPGGRISQPVSGETVAAAPSVAGRPAAAARPGPTNNYPVPPAMLSEHSTSPGGQTVEKRGGARPGLFGSRSGAHESSEPSPGTATDRAARTASTPTKSVPSVTARSSGGSRSGDRAVTSSGSGRSGGSSAGASARSGGSSGGSHSSGSSGAHSGGSSGSHSSSSGGSHSSGGGGSSGGGHSSSSGTKR